MFHVPDKKQEWLLKLKLNELIPINTFREKLDRYVCRIYFSPSVPAVVRWEDLKNMPPYFEPSYFDLEFKSEGWRTDQGPIIYYWSLKSKRMYVPESAEDQLLKTIACIVNNDACQVVFNPNSERAISVVKAIQRLLEDYNIGTNVGYKPSRFMPMDYVLANAFVPEKL